MKTTFLSAAFALAAGALFPALAADAAKETTYVVGMTGVTWAGCKTYVREAFNKLEGVSKVEISAGDKPETQKVLVTSKSPELTRDQFVKSLGDKADTYVVRTFGVQGAATYLVSMTGVTWAGCRKHVREAFMQLEGVVKVDIEPGEKPETQRVSVFSSSQGLTKEAAVKSLGDKAETYVVQAFGKEGDTSGAKQES